MVWFVRYSDFFRIDDVEILGEVSDPLREQVMSIVDELRAAGLDNLYIFDEAQALRRIIDLPRARSAEVRKDYPRKLILAIEERRPVAAARADDLFLIDRQGVLLAEASPAEIDRFALPILSGLRAARFAPGVTLDQPRLIETLEAIVYLGGDRPELARLFHEWHLNDDDEVVGILAGGVEVRFGGAHPLERMAKFEKALQEGEDRKSLTYLDLRFDSQIVIY